VLAWVMRLILQNRVWETCLICRYLSWIPMTDGHFAHLCRKSDVVCSDVLVLC
jgi:hypothetical protein